MIAALDEALERLRRRLVLRVVREHHRVRLDRARHFVQMRFVQSADAVLERQRLRLLGHELELSLQHLEQFVPLFGALVQLVELLPRGAFALVDADHPTEHIDRVLGLVERLPVDRAHRVEQLFALVVRRRKTDLAVEDPQQICPPIVRRVKHFQPVDRVQIRAVELEYPRVDVDRIFGLFEELLVRRTRLIKKVLLVVAIVDQVGLRHQDRHKIRPVLRRAVHRLELFDRLEVIREETQHIVKTGLRSLWVHEGIAVHLRRAPQQVALHLGLVLLGDLRFEHRHKVLVLGRLLRDPIEVLQRRLVRHIPVQRTTVGAERRVEVVRAVLLKRRHPVQQLDLLVSIVSGVDLHLERGDQFVEQIVLDVDRLQDAADPSARCDVGVHHPLQRTKRLLVAVVFEHHRLVEIDGILRLLQTLLQHQR